MIRDYPTLLLFTLPLAIVTIVLVLNELGAFDWLRFRWFVWRLKRELARRS